MHYADAFEQCNMSHVLPVCSKAHETSTRIMQADPGYIQLVHSHNWSVRIVLPDYCRHNNVLIGSTGPEMSHSISWFHLRNGSAAA